jgi:TPP-dependent indolepyruvate ferredoxin oxidoreductase alpha subunit
MIIIYGLIFASFVMLFKIVYDAQRKHNWFMKLKPGDKIKVWLYSQYCECTREAIVSKESDGKFIEAMIINPEECEACAEMNSKNKDGVITCWNKVTLFKKSDIGEIKK